MADYSMGNGYGLSPLSSTGGGSYTLPLYLQQIQNLSPALNEIIVGDGTKWILSHITNAHLPNNIDAAKIGAGAVNNTKFSYLQNVTGDIQNQLNMLFASSTTPYKAGENITVGMRRIIDGLEYSANKAIASCPAIPVLTDWDRVEINQSDYNKVMDAAARLSFLKGQVVDYASLPAVNNTVGDTYEVLNASGVWFINRKPPGLYIWNGTTWEKTTDFNMITDELSKRVTKPTGVNTSILQMLNANNELTNTSIKETSNSIYIDSVTKPFRVPVMTATQRLAIANPVDGDEVYDSTVRVKLIYDSGTMSWISQTSGDVGDYKYSAKTVNHLGWLLCDGSAISRTIYSALFAVIQTDFGAGDGSTTFNLPNFRGRVAGSVGTVGASTFARGNSIGEVSHALTINEMPTHNHSANGTINIYHSEWGTHKVLEDGTGATPLSTGSAGGGLAHNNMQPTLFGGNMFIKAI